MQTEEILQVVARCTCEVLPGLESHSFQMTDRLEELGANSVDRAEILTMVLESLNLKIPRVEMAGPKNVGELVHLLHAKMQ